MGVDYYAHYLKHALWTWREGRHSPYHSQPRVKDRASGRNEKRSARQVERRARETEY